jgi:hypothetical protein
VCGRFAHHPSAPSFPHTTPQPIIKKDEFRGLGIDLRALVNAGRLELHYSEIGLGGGARYSGDTPASSPAEVALRPFFGVYGPYSAPRDPWLRGANGNFRREFYSKLARWAGDPNNKTYRVSRLYVWSLVSFWIDRGALWGGVLCLSSLQPHNQTPLNT